ncbi:hypothetical protein CMUS01_15926 [Colletotrichum musicola]|uniref:Uncharacterized protein n=1 Tax=Colletotrichum musicola TaxID=2175873 RepID=A0A8H6ML61_9PEZI|nr:hypothetical protein CMUS01_15926 [Colletotrichum musicola]
MSVNRHVESPARFGVSCHVTSVETIDVLPITSISNHHTPSLSAGAENSKKDTNGLCSRLEKPSHKVWRSLAWKGSLRQSIRTCPTVDVVVEESRRQGAAVDVDGQEVGAEDMATVRMFPPRTTATTMAAPPSCLETFEGFRLSLIVEPAFSAGVFVVDITDSEGRSVSRAASALDDDFEPVRE